MTIKLRKIVPIFAPEEYKAHFARKSDTDYPLDALVRGPDEWIKWQEWRPKPDMFGRVFIFTLAKMYTRKYADKDAFLFGGIYRVTGRHPHPTPYDVELTKQAEEFIRRLVICCPQIPNGAIRVDLETYFDRCEVLEILEFPHSLKEKV